MSELDPAGIVWRKISNVVVGSVPATASLLGLCTWSAGSGASSSACTTTGRAVPGRTVSAIAPRNSPIAKSGPDTAIIFPDQAHGQLVSGPSNRHPHQGT